MNDMNDMKNLPKVDIVIVTWNDYYDLFECLESLKESTYENYGVIVVNAEPNEQELGRLIREYGSSIEILLTSSNLGAPGNRNLGIEYALMDGADYILLLDSDTILESNSLSAMVEVASSDSRVGAVQPSVFLYESPEGLDYAELPYDSYWPQLIPEFNRVLRILQRKRDSPLSVRSISSISAGASMVKRQTFCAVGLQDPLYFYGCEDLDFSYRAIRAGFKLLLAPHARIYHKRKTVSKARGVYGAFHAYYLARGRAILARKTLAPLPLAVYYVILFTLIIPHGFVINLKSKTAAAYLTGVRDGLIVRIK